MLAEYEFERIMGYDGLQMEYDEQQLTKGNNMTATYAPTASEVAAKQKEMDAEMLAVHPNWQQRTTPGEAQGALIIENAARENAEKYEAYISAQREKNGPEKPSAEPKPIIANWTAKYETIVNEDKSVSYVRDGEERIRDNGDGVQIVGNDKDSIRDAVRIGLEKWGNELQINTKDETKRDAILTEMAKQGARPQAELAERYAEIKAQVEKQRAEAELAAPQKVPEKQQEQEHEIEM